MKVAVNSLGKCPIKKDLIFRLFKVISLLMPRYASAELSVAFVTDRRIARLNSLYRGKRIPTDVLSFAARDSQEGIWPDHDLGEIIIATNYVKKQALRQNKSLPEEITVLLVHGFLHLVGYDHLNKKDEQKMVSQEQTILSRFGIRK